MKALAIINHMINSRQLNMFMAESGNKIKEFNTHLGPIRPRRTGGASH